MTDTPSRDLVLLASYPKSGNTWVRALFSGLRSSESAVELENLEGAMVASLHPLVCPFPINRLVMSEQELWHADACRLLRNPGRPFTLLKTHLALRNDPSGECVFPSEIVRGVIHVVRHPFDVAPSLANHLGVDIPLAVDYMLQDDFVSGGGFGELLPEYWGSWRQHTNSWCAPDTAFPVLRVRFEDLKSDPVAELRRMIAFVGIEEYPEDRLHRAAEAASFDRLRKQETDRGFKERSLVSSEFFRGGRTGDGWKQLSDRQRERILQATSVEMARLGYSDRKPA